MTFFALKKISPAAFKFAVTAALLVFLLRRIDFGGVFGVFGRADFSKMAQAFALFLLLNILIFFRWRILLAGLSVHVSALQLLRTYLSSLFVNLVFPSTLGGDTLRTVTVSRQAGRHSSGILATVILDRLFGFIGLVTLFGVVVAFNTRVLRDYGIVFAAILLGASVGIISAVMFSARFFRGTVRLVPWKGLREYFYGIHEASIGFRGKKRILFDAWLISVVAHLGLCFMYYLAAQAAHIPLRLVHCFLFVPIITVVSVIPVSVGGLGVRDAAAVVLLGRAGLTPEEAVILSLANFGFILILGLFGGCVYVFNLRRRRI